ncbi:LysR family transcriptional regulator [Staphylococcus sp. NAM3COL9]|uniref:LysR family transcriptional regulator n=1 Tax=Staphylococcus sp. NAM3COL9 TaxID=1667172 RepID=UPI00070B8649|nr:LysR family transcriptional regulator [Staphylococcus sp. NAM3COL9]KRG10823.1 transcriptional regulator [Staphylococcus sp. NAM3COL9]
MYKENAKIYLEAISRFGSISHAAKKLFISQPYLSKFVKDIESDVGTDLINREQNPITLTYAGERYLSYINQIEQLYHKMEYELQEISNLKRGRLKIGINPMLASHNLYNILPKFISMNPGIEVELIEDRSKQIEQLLEQKEIDISLTILPIDNDNINYEILYKENIYLLIPGGRPLIEKTNIYSNDIPFEFSDLNYKKFILLKSDMTLRKITNQFLNDYKITPQIVMETISVDNALNLASEGLGITFVPESVINNNVHKNAHYFKLDTHKYNNTVAIAYHKDMPTSKAAKTFIELAIRTFKSNK